jgi:NodT family efflux transporter outer membrane factor (OMF) lipoprotein
MKSKVLHSMFEYKAPIFLALLTAVVAAGCKAPVIPPSTADKTIPDSYGNRVDTVNMVSVPSRDFFKDQNLVALIDTALRNNQELQITLQEIEIAKNDIMSRQGTLLPTVDLMLGAGVEKVGRYTSQGAGDASTDIRPGQEVPDPLTDFSGAVFARWEIDIWSKLHNAKKAAITRYLSTVEGKNFAVTNLVAEVADSYYELLALDNELDIVRENIALQKNALEIVKTQKDAARVTELAVQKFQAEVLKSESLEFDLAQRITETENRLNFLLGRFPQPIPRAKGALLNAAPAVSAGIPSQLLANRPDIRQAELDLAAAKLDVNVARKEFYPSLEISGGFGAQAFKPSFLSQFPESMLYSLAGDLAAPLINRKAIKAEFYNASARQVQAMYNYQRSILNAYIEVSTQLSKIDNLGRQYDLKTREVDALTRSIDISGTLFSAARADYLEVLMTQRDALESRLELVETKKEQMNAVVNVYRDLGGGWQ